MLVAARDVEASTSPSFDLRHRVPERITKRYLLRSPAGRQFCNGFVYKRASTKDKYSRVTISIRTLQPICDRLTYSKPA